MTQITEQAKKDAERLLATAWPAMQVPVDPVKIARGLGIEVFAAQLDPNVSALIQKRPSCDPTIILNEQDSRNRQRFSCAHELGHFVRRTNSSEEVEQFEYVDLRGPLAAEGTDDEERYANSFAANLLMPTDLVKQLKKAGKSAVELSYVFEVSADAMGHVQTRGVTTSTTSIFGCCSN